MLRPVRLLVLSLTALGALFALHVQLNKGGWPAFAGRLSSDRMARGELVVGFLPVTCHLTCPVTRWLTSHSDSGAAFRSKRYTDFATIAEELKHGTLRASFLLAPLAMTLSRQGVPLKIVHLGHRDGTTLVVHEASDIRDFEDLVGKTIAIPHMYSNQRILMVRRMEQLGIAEGDIHLVVYPPPEMPAALQNRSIDGFIVGEPNPAKAEIEGFGRVLAYTKDLWPNFISCVLVVRDDLVQEDRALVQELVDGIAASGQWIETPGDDLAPGLVREEDGGTESATVAVLPRGWPATHRTQAAVIAGRREFYSQDPALIRFVLSQPPDRVRYNQLVPARPDFEEIQRYAEKLGYFAPSTPESPFGVEDYCDPSFAVAAHR
jgi:NitT/TauT family transport system substrate-binding protein